MPTKILRLGFTECSLLFLYWLERELKGNPNIKFSKDQFTKWLYTTSGYYDKKQIGNYFNVIHGEDDPPIYKQYMETLYEFIRDADIFEYNFHQLPYKDRQVDFKKELNVKKECEINQEVVFRFIEGKKVLVISPFADLIISQYYTGNVARIFLNAPYIKKFVGYRFPYTFFNNGPHQNILETSDLIFHEIIQKYGTDYDSVLLSIGAYGCILAKKFYDIGKDVCIVGGNFQAYFGIMNRRFQNRNNKFLNIQNRQYWIMKIPDEYKPDGYMSIEDGCYW